MEATPAGDLELYVLVPPEKRNTIFGEVPRYVLVDLDDQAREDMQKYLDLQDRIRHLEDTSQVKEKRPYTPNKKNIDIDQVDLRLVSPEGENEVRIEI